ncbi:MAG: exodeoxyribonuclease VII large subunit [Ruminococcus sp.]|nr:exodeoxyribonuclease VII large subunit [Ruminococcus sp.]
MSKPKVYTVSQLNYSVKTLLDNTPYLSGVFVTGEISNLKDHYSSGHIYFSLKDNNAVLSAVMFAGSARNLKFVPQNGMKVIAFCRVSLYVQSGTYQIIVEDMQPDGIGALTIAFEQLKKKLEQKGIFAQEHKKPIPKFPKTVGVITSPTGAAVQVRNILTRRFPNIDIVLCPVLVQGTGAAPQLIQAVNMFNDYDCADVIIIGRGGGSIEDLWAFNDENLAYAIYASNIPVISAVGHETDFTICDFVADLRAPTPSAAAELAVPDREEMLAFYNSQRQYLTSMLDKQISDYKKTLANQKAVILKNSPERAVALINTKLDSLSKRLINSSERMITIKSESVKKLGAKLESLNPVSVLQRGYSIAEKNGIVINSLKEIKIDDIIDLTLKDGTVKTKVVEN